MNEMTVLDKRRINELVASADGRKRATLSKALSAAANYSKTTLKNFEKARELVEAMFENEWLLGRELNRLFDEGEMREGRPEKTVKNFTVSDFGISRPHAELIRGIASLWTQRQLAEWVREKTNDEKRVLPKLWALKRLTSKMDKEAEDKLATARARRALKKHQDESGVFHGNAFDLAEQIPDSSCALIFTDPPYDRKSLPMFSDLAALADRVLVNGGSLITYCGQYVLPDVISQLSANLRYFWICCCLHSGGTAGMREYGIKVKWKPLLWFTKGEFRRDRETWVDDLVHSQQEKDVHPWQQSVSEATYYISCLTVAGELVVDPFCGGGTTAMAAKRLGRQWWTADIDPKHVQAARRRINDENLQ